MTATLTPPADAPLPWRVGYNYDRPRIDDANGEPILVDAAVTLFLVAAANAYPGLVAERDALRIAIAQACRQRDDARNDRDLFRVKAARHESERDTARARVAELEAQLAKQAPVIEAARRQQVCRSNADNYSAHSAWASATLDTERAVTDLFINALETP